MNPDDAVIKALASPLINYARGMIKSATPNNHTATLLKQKLDSIGGDFMGIKGLLTDIVTEYTNVNEEYVKSIIRELAEDDIDAAYDRGYADAEGKEK